MKKTAVLVMGIFILNILAAASLFMERDDEIRAIKRAVKVNPVPRSGKEVKCLKVIVTDTRRKKDTVKITIPLSFVELFKACDRDKHIKIACDINLGDLLSELERLGPDFLIEISDDEEVLKIWLE